MEEYKEIRGIIKVVNSVFENSSNIQFNGIKVPISKKADKKELLEWSNEINNIIEKVLKKSYLEEFRKNLLEDCHKKLENYCDNRPNSSQD